MKNNIKWFLVGAIAVIIVVFGIIVIKENSISGLANNMMIPGYNNDSNKDKGNVIESTNNGMVLGEKVIYTANISLRTDEYKGNIQKIKDIINNNNAGIANFTENANNRNDTNKQYMYANIIVKVPQANFKNFIQQIKDCGMYVNSYNEGSEDITEVYMDVESKLVSLKQQEQILNDLLSKAKNVSEIIEINNQKQQVIQQIEYNTKIQQTYDNKIAYSTVTINIQEVDSTQVTQKGFVDRLGDTIISGMEGLKFLTLNLLLLVVYLLPFTLVIGIIVLIVVLIVRKIKKNREIKNTNENK